MKNVYLVGMPSSGKSTLGWKLAKALNYRFVDLDRLIVRQQKKTISDIFRDHGEEYFRMVESKVLKDTRPNHRVVIATGGGAPCFFDNMEFIKSNGVSLFLDVEPGELARRIAAHGQDDRPLLSGITELRSELEQKLLVRLPYYTMADFTIQEKSGIQSILRLVRPLL